MSTKDISDYQVCKEKDALREALEQIEAEMAFPNQLETGFVHGRPTFKDMASRVEIAANIARQALEKEREDVPKV